MSATIRIRFGLQIVLVCLHSTPSNYHHCLIWRHWTYEMPVRYILSNVWVRLNIFSPLTIIQYVGLYVFSLSISLVMIERIHIYIYIYTLSYYHHQIGSMNYYPLLRVSSWNNGVRCMSLYCYEFVIWPDCFVGHSCPGGICHESGPLSLTCSITTMLDTLLTIDI